MTAKIFDPDFGKDGFARHLFRLRFRRLELSQRAFSELFALSYSVVRDAEQGARPTPSLRLIVAAIALDPAFMTSAAERARGKEVLWAGIPRVWPRSWRHFAN